MRRRPAAVSPPVHDGCGSPEADDGLDDEDVVFFLPLLQIEARRAVTVIPDLLDGSPTSNAHLWSTLHSLMGDCMSLAARYPVLANIVELIAAMRPNSEDVEPNAIANLALGGIPGLLSLLDQILRLSP